VSGLPVIDLSGPGAAREIAAACRDWGFFQLPFFYNPSYRTDCAPLPIAGGEAPRYRPINWGEFRRARTAGDYADYGKEIQIEDFRIG